MISDEQEIVFIRETLKNLDERISANQKELFTQAAKSDAQYNTLTKFLETLEADIKEVKLSNAEAIKELRISNEEAMSTFNQVKTSLKVLIFLGGVISTLLTILITIGDFFG